MPVNIHGKSYFTVAERIQNFREAHQEYAIETQLISADEEKVVMKALIFKSSEEGAVPLATGYAEEVRGASNINKTSALENAETSAVGRALAFLGFAGTEIASADELAGALKQQAAQELIEYNSLVREHWHEISEAKNLLAPQWGELQNQPNVTDARATLKDLGDGVYQALWRAPTKGGCFTTVERNLLKQPERAMELVGAEAL